MINIPTEVQMIFDFHFLTLSSSLDEKRSLSIPIMRNKTAMAIKKFLIWNATVVKLPIIQSDPYSHAEKKKSWMTLPFINSPST